MAHIMSPNKDLKPQKNPFLLLYLSGFGRSGTTLLERLLDQVQGVVAIGEGRHLWTRGLLENQRCSCGAPFLECVFWSDVLATAFNNFDFAWAEGMNALKYTVDRYRYIPLLIRPGVSPVFAKRLKRYSDSLIKFYRGIQTVTGARVIVDSSKDPSYAFLLSAIPELGVHILHMTRDSRGVAYSWQRMVARPEITASRVFMPRFSPVQSAQAWNTNNFYSELLRITPSPYLHIRYEDLTEFTVKTLRKITTFIGEEDGNLPEIHADRTVNLSSYHTISGNPLRFKRGGVKIKTDDEWIRHMNPRDKSLVTFLTFPLLIKYGYKLARID